MGNYIIIYSTKHTGLPPAVYIVPHQNHNDYYTQENLTVTCSGIGGVFVWQVLQLPTMESVPFMTSNASFSNHFSQIIMHSSTPGLLAITCSLAYPENPNVLGSNNTLEIDLFRK